MYVPHADYPKNQEPFNIIKMLPELFKGIDFNDFIKILGGDRFIDFDHAEFFLYASQYQSNYGAKLVMLLSAVERSNGTWKPLESVLKGKEFKKKLQACEDGKEAGKLLEKEIETYLDNFGSTRSVVKFYQDNLTLEQKQVLINGIYLRNKYKKQTIQNGKLFIPVREPQKEFADEMTRLNYELAVRLKNVVYNIRSGFVHQASYIPFPDKKYIKEKIYFRFERYEEREPKEEWHISLPFETLHELTRSAFINFWREEYEEIKGFFKKEA